MEFAFYAMLTMTIMFETIVPLRSQTPEGKITEYNPSTLYSTNLF